MIQSLYSSRKVPFLKNAIMKKNQYSLINLHSNQQDDKVEIVKDIYIFFT